MEEKKKRNNLKNLVISIVASIAFIAMGISCILLTAKERQRTKNWPTIEAQITGYIEYKKDDNYEHDIYVSYEIGDEYHSNVKINQFDGATMKPEAIITVKYNPLNHGEAVYSSSGFNALFFVGSSLLIAAGIAIPTVLIISKIRKRKKENNEFKINQVK